MNKLQTATKLVIAGYKIEVPPEHIRDLPDGQRIFDLLPLQKVLGVLWGQAAIETMRPSELGEPPSLGGPPELLVS